MKKLACVLFLLLSISQVSYGQLSNFTLTVTKTDESCTGNGSLSFNVSNTVTGSTIIYRIYLLPDAINPIATLSANTFGGLAAGTYRVIATQTLGSTSGTQQQDITILDTRTYVTYQTSGVATSCNTGTINVNVLTGNPVSYEIISGPVIVPPQASGSFTNLPEGTYNVRVNDACGEGVVQTYTLTFSNLPNLTINTPVTDCPLTSCTSIGISYSVVSDGTADIRYPLNIEITVFPPTGAAIVITQTITSGGSGSLSLSDIIPFYYDQLYSYTIKIVDNCGNVYIKNNIPINLNLAVGARQTNTGCIKGIRVELCNFLPPYNVTFLSAPAGFNPSAYNSIHPGPFTAGVINYVSTPTDEIPNGDYTIQVTDACNHTATCQVTVKKIEPLYIIVVEPTTCDINTFIQIPRDIFAGPFITTAIFTAASANLGSPIPYDVTSQIQSGILLMQLPPGTYTIQGMDVCGHPYSYTFTMPPKAFAVNAVPININGCSPNGKGSIRLTSVGALITSIIITQAPAALAQPLPYDVSFLIPPGGSSLMTIPNLPAGDYVLHITDSCGNNYIKNVTISVNISIQPLILIERKGCGENYDSIAMASPNGALLIVIITAAPPSFPFTLPYDVSFNIATNGNFYMNSFPEGSYTFYTKDICGIERTSTHTLTGYHSGGTIDIINNCGAFNVNMNFTDNAVNQANLFWLQKLNTATGQWTHPLTGVVYPPGSLPNAGNSYMLTNSTINYNIMATGTFRILARYSYYDNDTPSLISCVETIKTFDYTGELKILSAYAIPCVNGGSQVFIITNGTPPLNYQVTTKDGLPFLIDNGSSNSFSGLQPGVYNFRVKDFCGNIVNRLFDINTLQQPEISSSNFCEGLNGQLSVQPFSFLFYEWWKDGSPGTILSTTNTLTFSPYTNANAGIYHVRIYSTTLNSCVDRVLTYTLSPTSIPNAGLDGTKVICGDSTGVNLFTLLNGTYDVGGTWTELTSSGMLIGNNWIPAGLSAGTYVFKYTVNGFCNATDFAIVTITLNPAVEDPVISANPDYCTGDTISLSIQSIPNAVYQWSGPNTFSSSLQNPTIPNANAANAGTYTVTATIGDCHSLATVVINSKPSPDYTYESSCNAGVFTVTIIPAQDSTFDPNTATYSWTGPNNFTSTNNPLILTNQLSGNYNVVVTNNEGCFSPQTIAITTTFCDFPNVITPGVDGFNDSFDLTNYDVEWFEVYNRWGRLVYKEANYISGWYGQNMDGGFLPDSTYYYIVRLRNGEEKQGWIFVGRG
ncbi:T9SS type B sorting domain-containing protein [Flavobacterium sp. 25HG05S-40]|uniref:T9SS type B sorting domain-containing protein n=1 Tax=Flavobacterium sp. 25HG05S-40 TaxID=3458682 RepID=UPI004044D05F